MKDLISLQDNMRSFALSLTSNYQDAEDLLQDTTLKVLRNKDRYVENINFKGWVLTVMRNIFINNYHRIVRSQSIMDDQVDPYNVSVMGEEGLDTPDGNIAIEEITKAISELPEHLSVPLNMYIAGYKYNEVADALDVPLGTVKSRIFLARKELKISLENYVKEYSSLK